MAQGRRWWTAQESRERQASKHPTKSAAWHQRRALAGVTKWIGGTPTLHYCRSGYEWVNGQYVKTDPKGTGITQSFGTNRASERAERQASRKRTHARAAAKRAGLERYWRTKDIAAARQRELRADKQRMRSNG